MDVKLKNHDNSEEMLNELNLKTNLKKIGHSLIVLSGKGGVGKSTVSVNLAQGLLLQGYTVGLLDVDLHGPSLAKMLGIEGQPLGKQISDGRPSPVQVHENFYALSIATLLQSPDQPVVWRGPMKYGAIRQFLMDIEWPEIDFLVIDSPPGTGDEPLSVCQIIEKVDGAVIVATPQDVALADARKTIKFAQMLKIPVMGIIENMSGLKCPHCGEIINVFKAGGAEKTAKDFDIDLLGHIPIDPDIVESGDSGKSFIYHHGNTEAGKAMDDIVKKILEKINQ